MNPDTIRPLAGIRVESAAAPLSTELPRLDIAAFVGFAERLPPVQPVVLESPESFSVAFGGEVELAWDDEAGSPSVGQLGAAVRAFFAQGGRRCHVVGVAVPEPGRELDLGVFLDPRLAAVPTTLLVPTATELRWSSPAPTTLRGIHTLLDVEEPSLIAVPDAVLRGWSFAAPPEPPMLPAAPVLRVIPDGRDAVQLGWTSAGPGAKYVVEESANPGFTESHVVATTTGLSLRLEAAPAEAPRRRWWRVRALAGKLASDWSNAVSESLPAEIFGRCASDAAPGATSSVPGSPGFAVAIPTQGLPRLKRPSEFSESDHAALLAVHRALLRMCRARGDMFAALSLPAHADAAFAGRHVTALQPGPATALGASHMFNVAPLTGAEAETPSFGALYHPWLASPATGGGYRLTPPDGAVCGLIARRTLSRGAWIAPANETFSGVIGLQPALTQAARQQLHDLQVNEVMLTPHGIRCLAADTLCPEPELRAINVRRLLMLLRRLAQREGTALVFEPHGDALRRWVQRTFEELMERLFRLGAFAGRTRAESFQVVTDDSLNPQASVNAGRFVVELRVAPSRPLSFLTVRLVGGEGRLEVT